QMYARQQAPDFAAVGRIGHADMPTRQTWLQQGRFFRQGAQGHAFGRAHGMGHGNARLMQHVQQLDDERQVLGWTALDQGQNVFALLQADEEIAVLGASDDTLEVTQAPQPERRQKGFQFVLLKWREYRHGGSSP